jgi:hypothetical protein
VTVGSGVVMVLVMLAVRMLRPGYTTPLDAPSTASMEA